MGFRSKVAIYSAKFVYRMIKCLGRGSGSALPGRVARRIDPEILPELAGMVRKGIIAVTGTNGKTTTNNLLAHVLEEAGEKVLCNRMGANLMDGVVTAFVLACGSEGRLDMDYACIEVDEIAAGEVFPKLAPDCVLLTNIFRDQLDRTGEVDITCGRIRKAVRSLPGAKLVFNCDDICSFWTAAECGNHTVTYGIGERIDEGMPAGIGEGGFCPFCGGRLKYDVVHYGQLGRYRCPACGLTRPEPDVTVTQVSFQDGKYSFALDGRRISSGVRAPYNVYNTLSAYAALKAMDAPREGFPEAAGSFDYGNMRECAYRINNAHVQLYLAKNPVGLQQKIFLILHDPSPKDILIQINDSKLDGQDVSWLWDVDYGALAQSNASSIVTGGTRGEDMGLCLKYEDILYRAVGDVRRAVEELTLEGSRNLYIITNYSGLYGTNRMLNELQAVGKGGVCG